MFQVIKRFGKYSIDEYGIVINNETNKMLRWSQSENGYFCVTLYGDKGIKRKSIHTLVWDNYGDKQRGNGLVVDHIDEKKHNNHISNLQLLTHRENTIKRSIYYKKSKLPAGVSYHQRLKRWEAKIRVKDQRIYLGIFNSAGEASLAYQKALEQL